MSIAPTNVVQMPQSANEIMPWISISSDLSDTVFSAIADTAMTAKPPVAAIHSNHPLPCVALSKIAALHNAIRANVILPSPCIPDKVTDVAEAGSINLTHGPRLPTAAATRPRTPTTRDAESVSTVRRGTMPRRVGPAPRRSPHRFVRSTDCGRFGRP